MGSASAEGVLQCVERECRGSSRWACVPPFIAILITMRSQADDAALDAPSVSVVIPTHNRSSFLRQAIDSVLAQEHAPAEVIVVDDCSTDDTPGVVASYGDRVTYVRSEQNIERAAARNLGASVATSPMLAFLDSDDEWLPGKLAAQLEPMRRGAVSVTGVRFIDEAGLHICREKIPRSVSFERVCVYNPIPGSASSMVLPLDLFQELGGFPMPWRVQGSEAWLFLVKLHHAGHTLAIVPEVLIAYRVHAANSTADQERVAVSMWSAVEWMDREGIASQTRLREIRGRTATVIARGYAHKGHWVEATSWSRRALRRGSPREAARAIVQVPASAARGFLRRRGT